jgi:hypothetical protein
MISYLFEKDRIVQLAFMDKFSISIELVAAIAGDGRGMVVNVGFSEAVSESE